MTDVKPSAAVEMTLLTKERPLVSEMKAWLEDNLTRLPPDQRALVMGVEPQGIYAFEPATVLPTLVVDAGTGITAPMKAARDAWCARGQRSAEAPVLSREPMGLSAAPSILGHSSVEA